jgi:preprotein translocase subunit SecF
MDPHAAGAAAEHLTMIRLFHNANFPFLRYRKWTYVFSGVVVAATLVSILLHGGLRYSIDFTGGTLIQLDFTEPVEVQTLRQALIGMEGLRSHEVQHFGDRSDVVVRAQVPAGQEEEFGDRIEAHLRQTLRGQEFTVARSESVGPKIGEELKQQALLAILYALVLILIYVAFRFDLKFGVGAIVATAHDLVFSVGAFSLLDKEISLAVVAAFLTIVGYSLNDTVVVFDRIREDLRTRRRSDYEEVVNAACNETLSRTIITGGTTLLVLVLLYFLGGEVIHDFAFALIIGILVGTYSSIFMASAIVVDWKRLIEDRGGKPAGKPGRARAGSRP